MTSIAFIMGCLPLAVATGAGAAARQVVGVGVIGGMMTAVFIGVFFIPSFFYLIAKLAGLDKKAARKLQEKEQGDRKSTRLNSSHSAKSRMPSSA